MAEAENVGRVRFGSNANPADVSPFSLDVLLTILDKAEVKSCVISSTARRPLAQARVMFLNCATYGADHQFKLYREPGQQVIAVYDRLSRAHDKKSQREIIAAMADKIIEVGPQNVSHHACDLRVMNVFDVDPHSVSSKLISFEQAVREESRVSKFLVPPQDPGYHIEIPQPQKGATV